MIKTFSLGLGLLKVWIDVKLESSNCRNYNSKSARLDRSKVSRASVIFYRILKPAQAHMTCKVKCFTPSVKGKNPSYILSSLC